jgi:hypothetical protein
VIFPVAIAVADTKSLVPTCWQKLVLLFLSGKQKRIILNFLLKAIFPKGDNK